MENNFLSREDLKRLSKTAEGKKIVFNYIVSGRIALSVQQIFDKLEIIPKNNIQTEICNIIYNNLFITQQEEIFAFIESIKESVDSNTINNHQFYVDDDAFGNC